MFDSVDTTCEAYETIIGSTTFRARYIGEKSFLEVIKAAIKRDVKIVKN